jgi:hypothetical protein
MQHRTRFPIALTWAALWTLPGVAIPLLVASRSRVFNAMPVPLCTAGVVILLAFALTGLASYRLTRGATSERSSSLGRWSASRGRPGGSRFGRAGRRGLPVWSP